MSSKISTKVMPYTESAHLTINESKEEGQMHNITSNVKSLTKALHVYINRLGVVYGGIRSFRCLKHAITYARKSIAISFSLAFDIFLATK